MLPWVFGFTWQPGNLIFLGIFYSVEIVIVTSFIAAANRSVKGLNSDHVEEISWHASFAEIPASTKVCRHVINGELQSRTCPNGFDCRVCELHPRIVLENALDSVNAQKLDKAGESILGLNMPADRLYHRGHTWVKREHDGTLTIGLDEFAERVIGKPDAVSLPEIGDEIKVNGTGLVFEKDGAKIRILSPVDGEVLETSDGGNGFYIRVKPKHGIDLRHLLRGSEIQPWIIREIERLESVLTNEKVGVSLADGGELVSDLPKSYPEVNWDSVLGEMFLEP